MAKMKLRCGVVVLFDDEFIEFFKNKGWHLDKNGYVQWNTTNKQRKCVGIKMHRHVLGAKKFDGKKVDHINGNKLDNRRENLRFCNIYQNAQNQRKNSRNTSGLKGASFDKSRGLWIAMIGANGKQKNLGRYATKEAAHEAYCKAALLLHGEFANFGTITGETP